jgi:hypothetical protein
MGSFRDILSPLSPPPPPPEIVLKDGENPWQFLPNFAMNGSCEQETPRDLSFVYSDWGTRPDMEQLLDRRKSKDSSVSADSMVLVEKPADFKMLEKIRFVNIIEDSCMAQYVCTWCQ